MRTEVPRTTGMLHLAVAGEQENMVRGYGGMQDGTLSSCGTCYAITKVASCFKKHTKKYLGTRYAAKSITAENKSV